LLTGIHAVGSHGIIDYLRRELTDLYGPALGSVSSAAM
jgi:hypothetical protein